MCGGVHYGEVEGLVSVERWSCSRGASCVVEYIMRRLRIGLHGSYHFLLQSQQFCPQCLVTVKEKTVQADEEWKDATTVNTTQEIMYYRTHIHK